MKVFAWLNSDLDGIGSAIVLGNIFKNFEYKSVFFGDFERQFTEWSTTEAEKYDKIFVVGMVYDQKMINQLDDHKIIFVSDGPERLNVFDSTWVQKETTSCSKLLYNKFKEKVEFPNSIKQLIVYIDDYNSQTLKYEESKYINALHRKATGSKRFDRYVNRFWKGFDGFTESELGIVQTFFDEIAAEGEGLDLYSGEFKGSKVLATFSKKSANEVAKLILDNHEVDAVMVVNLDTQFVSFRAKEGTKADARLMAENLCSGGGVKSSAGGKLTPKFMDFTQTLIQL